MTLTRGPSISRRRLVATTGLAFAGAATPAFGAADKPGLRSEFLFSVRADLAPPQDIGRRQIYIVTGGEFEGPRLRGKVLAGGGDWLRAGADGVSKLDVRATLETDDAALVYVYYEGRVQSTDGGLYFRTTPYFETRSEKYSWLNGIVSVGVNTPGPQGQVAYDIHRIL